MSRDSEATNRAAVANLSRCWDSLEELLPTLSDEQWATPSLCPEWTVRGVVEHLAGVEQMLAGVDPTELAESLPFEKVGEALEEYSSLSNAEMLDRLRSLIGTRRTDLGAFDDDQLALPSMTPVGPGTYGRFMAVRVFDFWVHEQDIRHPLGLAGHESGPAAEMAIDEVQGSLGYIVGKKIAVPDGASITFDLTGPVSRAMHVKVDGRAAAVEQLDEPTVTLTTDSTTFALLACGRIDPEGPIEAGAISWSGDDELGARAARNLRFTM